MFLLFCVIAGLILVFCQSGIRRISVNDGATLEAISGFKCQKFWFLSNCSSRIKIARAFHFKGENWRILLLLAPVARICYSLTKCTRALFCASCAKYAPVRAAASPPPPPTSCLAQSRINHTDTTKITDTCIVEIANFVCFVFFLEFVFGIRDFLSSRKTASSFVRDKLTRAANSTIKTTMPC